MTHTGTSARTAALRRAIAQDDDFRAVTLLPRFADDPVPDESFHRYWAARDIRAMARLLRDAIGRYRHAVTAPVDSVPRADPLLPF